MNVKKSVQLLLLKNDRNMVWLAEELGITRQASYQLINRRTFTPANLERLAELFDLKVSEFIALGESTEAA